jgi:hypothetical protein
MDETISYSTRAPNFNIKQVRMKRGEQEEIIIEDFRVSDFVLDALRG